MNRDTLQKFIDEDINPGLEMHGGYLKINKFDEENSHLYLEMGGGCQGCASSAITLQLMIRELLMEQFPLLKEIEDVTDHNSGENPYYTREW